MDKFLNIAVTGEGYQLVPCGDVKLVIAASATTTTLNYGSGKVVTITHATVGAASATNSGTQFREFIQSEMTDVLSSAWTDVSKKIYPTFAVSGIDIA